MSDLKNILTITQANFENCLPQLSFQTLKDLHEGIYLFLRRRYSTLTDDMVYDLERKQTKIMREMQRRGILNSKTNQEYHDWLFKKHERRIF